LTFGRSALVLSPERQSAQMSKKWWVRPVWPVWPWTLRIAAIWNSWRWRG